jgi:hypothetical protein
MSQQRALLLRNGLLAGCAFAAIVLLASFYSIVSGAVDRAARQRLAVADTSAVTTQTATGLTRAERPLALFARAGN